MSRVAAAPHVVEARWGAARMGSLIPPRKSTNLYTESGDDRMIRKLKSGEYRLYSRKKNPKTGKRRNLGTFKSRAAAEKHEKAVQYFKRH